MGPSGFLAIHMLPRKKKQLLQLSVEKMTAEGIKPHGGVQLPVKEPGARGSTHGCPHANEYLHRAENSSGRAQDTSLCAQAGCDKAALIQ